jgi:hypothetical protein
MDLMETLRRGSESLGISSDFGLRSAHTDLLYFEDPEPGAFALLDKAVYERITSRRIRI